MLQQGAHQGLEVLRDLFNIRREGGVQQGIKGRETVLPGDEILSYAVIDREGGKIRRGEEGDFFRRGKGGEKLLL